MICSTQSPPKQDGSEKSTIRIKIKKLTVKAEKVPAQWRPRTNQAHRCSSYLISYHSFPTLINPETENPSPPFSRENPNFETFPENLRIQSSKASMGKKRNKNPEAPRFQPPRYKWVPKSRPAPVETRNWLELPRDVTVLILSRLGAVGILWSAQYVCMAWRQICKDPLMWRTIDMRNDGDLDGVMFDLDSMCRRAVDRSAGNLVDLNVEFFGSDCLLNFITDRY